MLDGGDLKKEGAPMVFFHCLLVATLAANVASQWRCDNDNPDARMDDNDKPVSVGVRTSGAVGWMFLFLRKLFFLIDHNGDGK